MNLRGIRRKWPWRILCDYLNCVQKLRKITRNLSQ